MPRDLWEQTLEPQLIAALDDLRVPWHSLVPVRMKYTDEEIGAPVTVMVCVERACEVPREDAEGAARRCVELLGEHEVTKDVEVVVVETQVWPEWRAEGARRVGEMRRGVAESK